MAERTAVRFNCIGEIFLASSWDVVCYDCGTPAERGTRILTVFWYVFGLWLHPLSRVR